MVTRRNQKRPIPSTTSQVAPSSRLFIMDGTLPQKTPEVLPLAATFTPGTIALGSFIVALLLVGEHPSSTGCVKRLELGFTEAKFSSSSIGSDPFPKVLRSFLSALQMAAKQQSYPKCVLVPMSSCCQANEFGQFVYGQSFPTQTSMQPNTSTFVLSPKKTIQITDIPGHPRLRGQFEEHMPNTRAIGFVVDANTISRNAAAVAE